MKIKCPFCNQHYEIESSHIGQEAQCSSCGQDFFIDKKDVYDVPQAQPEMQIPHEPEPMTPAPPPIPVVASNTTVSVQQQSAPAMKPLTCEMCGSTDLMKQDGVFVCQSCGTKYSVEEAKKMMISGTVNVAGTVKVDTTDKVKNLLTIARSSFQNQNYSDAEKYYSMLLAEGAYSWEAMFYSVCCKAVCCGCDSVVDSVSAMKNSIISIIKKVSTSEAPSEDKLKIYEEISTRVRTLIPIILNKDKAQLDENRKPYRCFWEQADLSTEAVEKKNEDNAKFRHKNIGMILAKTAVECANSLEVLGLSNAQISQCVVPLWKEAINTYQLITFRTDAYLPHYISKCAEKIKKYDPTYATPVTSTPGCYIATAVYGSYDCPQVWTLRRYRDDSLASTFLGRLFIHTYYTISPTLIKWFGHTKWFKCFCKRHLDKFVQRLNSGGVSDQHYQDKNW